MTTAKQVCYFGTRDDAWSFYNAHRKSEHIIVGYPSLHPVKNLDPDMSGYTVEYMTKAQLREAQA